MILDLKINYSKAADRFIDKNPNQLTRSKLQELIIDAVKRLNGKDINIDLCELKGNRTKLYRIRKGKIRIIFSYFKGDIHIINVEDIGYRGDIYK